MMELNRISSHLVWLATTGMELGALSMMIYGFRDREYILDIFELASGLADEPRVHPARGVWPRMCRDEAISKIREFLAFMPKRIDSYESAALRQPDLAAADPGRRGPGRRRAASRSG